MLSTWKENLKCYIESSSKYLIVNDCTYVKVDDVCSGVVRQGGTKIFSWFRLIGLTICEDDLNLINGTFWNTLTVTIEDNIREISKEDFDKHLESRCKCVFADTIENFQIQSYHYLSRFCENVLEKHPDMFPQYVSDFVMRLEDQLDKEYEDLF